MRIAAFLEPSDVDSAASKLSQLSYLLQYTCKIFKLFFELT